MKIKHWAGYGCVTARKVKSNPYVLHIRVEGNHEWGIVREDEYDLFNWLVRRFDKDILDYAEFHRMSPAIRIVPGYRKDPDLGMIETCDYYFKY